jgi:hypothetical protein
MSAESLKNFLAMLTAGLTIVASRYEDVNGQWAKDIEFVDRIRIRMSDATNLFITYAEFKTLTSGQKTLINLAPSDEISLDVGPI